MSFTDKIAELSHPQIMQVYQELESYQDYGFLNDGIARGIIEGECSSDYPNSFVITAMNFQMHFYRFLADKYMAQKVL